MSDPKRRTDQLAAILSSSETDLALHRQQAEEACLREGVLPLNTKNLPGQDIEEVTARLELVDQADIYVGIYAWRYGRRAPGHDISIVEMEFDRALERGIPILIFLMDRSHPLMSIDAVEADAGAQEKLKAFKERATAGRQPATFTSPEELRGLIIQSLADLKRRREAAASAEKPPAPLSLHPINLIPEAPEAYRAHPYTLLAPRDLVGRQKELAVLTDWATRPEWQGIRLFCVVAVGGMGKSALTWKWFQESAPSEMPYLHGRLWWSFYESDAHFENFVIRAQAYVTNQPESEVRKLKAEDREEQLLRVLDARPFLLVLDGLERILVAYAHRGAAHQQDDDELDQRTANYLAGVYNAPEDVKETYLEKHRLRACADPRAGRFLRRLATVRASRTLVSTRLYPAELQTDAMEPRSGCGAQFLRGLSDNDALNLWRTSVRSEKGGTSEAVLSVLKAFDNYPLLVRALAGEIATYRPAPGDFERWRQDNPEFDPVKLPLKTARTHVLEYALKGLGEAPRKVLHTLAAFRMPAGWDTLSALLVGEDRCCADVRAIDLVLTELEDRGLVGWERWPSNRYDLHPIVRGVVWQALAKGEQKGLFSELHAHFDAAPRPPKHDRVESLDDLTAGIELYHALIGLERYDDAWRIFVDHLERATLHRLSASRQRVELLEALFPDGLDALPRLRTARAQSWTLNALAQAYQFSGEPGRAVALFQKAAELDEREGDEGNQAVDLFNLSNALRVSGELYAAERSSSRALILARGQKNRFDEASSLVFLGLAQATRGVGGVAPAALRRALKLLTADREQQGQGVVSAYLSECALWRGEAKQALDLAQQAWDLAQVLRAERDFIRASRLWGSASLELGDLDTAQERLTHALTRARAVNHAEEELPALIALSERERRLGNREAARELLSEVWSAQRGPYPLFEADAQVVLGWVEYSEGNQKAAIEAARRAFELSWCQGPPFAYHYGMENARRLLKELGAPEPTLPPFDPRKFEPMPEVEINLDDAFHVEE